MLKAILFSQFICAALSASTTNWHKKTLAGIKFFEGFKAEKYYCCAGIPTIGYGCTKPSIVALGSITEQHAAKVLAQEFEHVKNQVMEEVEVELNKHQLYALTSFAFNCGMSNLRALVNGDGRLNEGNYKSVEKILPLYRMAGGQVKEGLIKRRAWELSIWKGQAIKLD